VNTSESLLKGGVKQLVGGVTFLNNGAMLFEGGTLEFKLASMFINNANLTLSGNASISPADSESLVQNPSWGKILKTGGPESTISVMIMNTGVIEVLPSSLRVLGGGLCNGSFALAGGSSLWFGGLPLIYQLPLWCPIPPRSSITEHI
jgi:hypothetical protein